MSKTCITEQRFRLTRSKSIVIPSHAFALLMGGLLLGAMVFFGEPLISFASAQDGQPAKATIVIESVSNSSATRGKNLLVTYYQDEKCSRRGRTDKVFKKNSVKDFHRFNALEVDLDAPFIFQVSYTEKRRRETRSCAAIANVTLQENRSYKAIFEIVDEVAGCNIAVFDVTNIINTDDLSRIDKTFRAAESTGNAENLEPDPSPEPDSLPVPVVDAKPSHTCTKVGKRGFRSGTPVYNYKDRLG